MGFEFRLFFSTEIFKFLVYLGHVDHGKSYLEIHIRKMFVLNVYKPNFGGYRWIFLSILNWTYENPKR